MKPTYVNGMVHRKLEIRDEDGALFSPDKLEVSIRWPDRTEELVTFGGQATTDAWLRLVSEGVFRFSCPAKSVAGKASLLVRITQEVSGLDQVEETRQIVDIFAKTNVMQDVP